MKAVKHHMEEEEEKVLPAMREKLSAYQLQSLAERLLSARKRHLGDQPDDLTTEHTQQHAANVDIEGTSGMSKDELKEKLAQEAET